MSSSWSSRNSPRDTSSGRLDLTPSSSRPTLIECRVCCYWRRGGGSVVWVFQPRWLKLQKPVPIDLEVVSHESSPTVHVPWNLNTPRRPDSVP
jgi:hypothetical protein